MVQKLNPTLTINNGGTSCNCNVVLMMSDLTSRLKQSI